MSVWRTSDEDLRAQGFCCLRTIGRLQRRFVIHISKTRSAVLGESIARLPSDIRGKQKGFIPQEQTLFSMWEHCRVGLGAGQ